MDKFVGLDGLANKRRNQMSLAEQKKMAEAKAAKIKQQQQYAWDGLDLLGGAGLSMAPANMEPPSSLIDDFGEFSIAPQAESPVAKTTIQSHTQAQGFEQQRSAAASPSSARQPATNCNSSGAPAFSPNASSAYGLAYPSERAGRPNVGSTDKWSDQADGVSVSDTAVAKLVDMGFSAMDATRGLQAMNGSVKGAVSWLMAEAQGLPLPKPRPRNDYSDVASLANEIGQNVLAKASNLWSLGRTQIAKAYAEYSHAPAGNRAKGMPVWMKNSGRPAANRAEEQKSLRTRDVSRAATSVYAGEQGKADTLPPRTNEAQSRAQRFRELQAQRFAKSGAAAGTSTSSSATCTRSLIIDLVDGEPTRGGCADTASDENTFSPAPNRLAPFFSSAAVTPEPEIDILGISETVRSQPLIGASADMVVAARHAGKEAHIRGDYTSAVTHFSQALQSLPSGHDQRIVVLANRAAANLKIGDARAALNDCQEALKMVPVPRPPAGTEIEPGVLFEDIWVKLLLRQASVLEHMERYEDALAVYQTLADNGKTTQSVLAGRRRCQALLESNRQPEERQQTFVKPISRRRNWNTVAAPTTQAGKAAVDNVKNAHAEQARRDAERAELHDSVSSRVDSWKQNRENNLRALLASLQDVLWAGCDWKPVSMSDLVLPKNVRVAYMKAVARTHPDKIPSSASTETLMIAHAVFVTIQKAWESFRVDNGM